MPDPLDVSPFWRVVPLLLIFGAGFALGVLVMTR